MEQNNLKQANSGDRDDNELLKPIEVATILRLHRSKVYDLLTTGALTVVTIGRAKRIPRASLVAFIQSHAS
jgi:excisionase family DNA binding protein